MAHVLLVLILAAESELLCAAPRPEAVGIFFSFDHHSHLVLLDPVIPIL